MSARERIRLGFGIAGVLLLAGAGVILFPPGGIGPSRSMVGWLGDHVRRKISPEQNADGPTYDDTAKASVALSGVVSQTRAAWPGESVAVVHGAAVEVAAGLLHRRDIEVGSVEDGRFVPWSMSPWQAEKKIRTELMTAPSFLTDESRYVFRRKPATN